MVFWILYLLLIVVPLLVVFKRKNYLTFLFTFLPFLMYAIYDVQSECIATNNSSEACVWGYLQYIYAAVFGSVFYLLVSAAQFLITKLRAKSSDAETRI